MPAHHHPKKRSQSGDYSRWYSSSEVHWWDTPNPNGTIKAFTMTTIGILLLLGFILAVAINGNTVFSSFLLLCSCALIIIGGIVLLLDLAEWVAKRFISSRKYCGCCASYKPQQADYSVGQCLASHSKGGIQRNHFCPYFHYSERAMVRDRLWQNSYAIERRRSIKGKSEHAGSDD
ncbi:MAG TPA: hypothetical protein VKT82_10905 [Ktedonobacterales bacterium]|nr:hypothetical protein [Ktedonobacterales bacterium]